MLYNCPYQYPGYAMGCQAGLGLYGGMAYAPGMVSHIHHHPATMGMGLYGSPMYGAALAGASALAMTRPYGCYSHMPPFY